MFPLLTSYKAMAIGIFLTFEIICIRDTRYGFKAELGPMRIPSHHILTLGVCRKYGLELADFNDQQTKFTRGLHGHPQEIYHKLKDRVGGCGVFGPDCHVKVEQLFECFNKDNKMR